MEDRETMNRVRDDFEEAVRTRIMPLITSLGLGDYWKHYHSLREMDTLAPEILADRQWTAFKSMLAHAYETVPLYRETMEEAGVTPDDINDRGDLAKLPLIDKRVIANSFPDRITSTTSDRSKWRYRSTSGTAFRLMSVTDYETRQWQGGLHLRSMDIASGFQPGKRQVTIRTQACTEACGAKTGEEHLAGNGAMLPYEAEWPPFGFAPLIRQEVNLPPLGGRGTDVSPEVLDDYLDKLDASAPYLLRGLPLFLLLLARRIKETGARPPRVERIVVQDSLAPPAVKREISEAFGCSVRETYGASEIGSMGGECEEGWVHVASDLFLIEILREDNTSAEPGEPGIVVISSMLNRAMVFLRYRVGDLGRLITGRCSCGRNTPRLIIEGRVSESLETDRGRVTARQASEFFHQFPGVDYFQLVERSPRSHDLLVVPSRNTALDREELLMRTSTHLGNGREIRLRLVDAIGPEESGKFALMKSLPRVYYPREA